MTSTIIGAVARHLPWALASTTALVIGLSAVLS